jgi:xanthine dehydrogenase accessory factor
VKNIYQKILEIQRVGERAALCTIVSTKGSTPLKAGAKMIVWEDGRIFGTIGGGNLENDVIPSAIKVLKDNTNQLFNHDLQTQHGMCCGGKLEIYIEPIMQAKRLYVFGAGHIGKSIVEYARDLDFEIFVIDDREQIFDDWETGDVNKMMVDFSDILPKLPFNDSTFIVIASYEHSIDREILAHCIQQPHAYLGMIGSKRKIKITNEMLISSGIATKEQLDKVRMPIGVDINAEDHFEIAISIVAELIKAKNKISVDGVP